MSICLNILTELVLIRYKKPNNIRGNHTGVFHRDRYLHPASYSDGIVSKALL